MPGRAASWIYVCSRYNPKNVFRGQFHFENLGLFSIDTLTVLWKEVDQWSQTEDTISEEAKTHIKRMYRSFEIAKEPLLKKWGMIAK